MEETGSATFVLIHGAGDSAWYWHLLEPELRDRGHDVVAMDLPCDEDWGRRRSEARMNEPSPLKAWPDAPTRVLVCRDDRFFPIDWLRRAVEEPLGITPDEIDSGRCVALSRPKELADRLHGFLS